MPATYSHSPHDSSEAGDDDAAGGVAASAAAVVAGIVVELLRQLRWRTARCRDVAAVEERGVTNAEHEKPSPAAATVAAAKQKANEVGMVAVPLTGRARINFGETPFTALPPSCCALRLAPAHPCSMSFWGSSTRTQIDDALRARLPSYVELPATRNRGRVILLGGAHVSSESSRNSYDVVKAIKPDAVLLEVRPMLRMRLRLMLRLRLRLRLRLAVAGRVSSYLNTHTYHEQLCHERKQMLNELMQGRPPEPMPSLGTLIQDKPLTVLNPITWLTLPIHGLEALTNTVMGAEVRVCESVPRSKRF